MYLQHYKLKEAPFNLTPDPDFLFKSKTYAKATADLFEGIKKGKGFILVVGEVGAGKTTLCRALFKELLKDKKIEVAVIFNSFLSPFELLKHINEDFLLPAKGETREELSRELTDFLLRCKSSDKKVVVVIDESQNLSFEALEQIRMLSNLETNKEKLIQIVMAGQPEFQNILKTTELRQLNQRITIRCHIKALKKEEIGLYIYHRLKIAGNKSNSLTFTAEAIEEISLFSAGIPRIINVACENALLLAAAKKTFQIDKEIARKAISKTKGIEILKPHKTTKGFYFFSILILTSILLLSAAKIFFKISEPDEQRVPRPPADVFSMIVKYGNLSNQGALGETAQYELASLDEQEYKISQIVFASLKILKMWQYKRALLEELWQLYQNRKDIDFYTISKNTGFKIVQLKTSPEMIRKLNMPLILKLFEEGQAVNYGVVTGFNEQGVIIKKLGEELKQYSLQNLKKIWFGDTIIFCRNIVFTEEILFKGKAANKKEMLFLQKMLLKAGFLTQKYVELNGIFDSLTEKGVKHFQKEYGLFPDGMLTKEAKILLYRIAQGEKIPEIYLPKPE